MPEHLEAFMLQGSSCRGSRYGITVLGLLILIIALVVGGILLVRYLAPATR